jgi:hemerythrin-like domain-containing protein
MQSIDRYRNTHAELRQMIDELRALMTPEKLRIRPNARTAYELLCDLGDQVQRHLAEEDRGLYPQLLIHEDPKIKSIAWGFISGERPLRMVFDNYHKRWLKNYDIDFSDAFVTETHQVFEMVAQRLDREEQVLLPKLTEIGMFHEMQA